MTPDEILALPAEELPWQLYRAGLAPPTVQRSLHQCLVVAPSSYGTGTYGEDYWLPHIRWDHAAPLLERFRLSVEHRQWPDGSENWGVRQRGRGKRFVVRFQDIPATICYVALMIHYAPHTPEAAPHG
jgi:hypothetical protein